MFAESININIHQIESLALVAEQGYIPLLLDVDQWPRRYPPPKDKRLFFEIYQPKPDQIAIAYKIDKNRYWVKITIDREGAISSQKVPVNIPTKRD